VVEWLVPLVIWLAFIGVVYVVVFPLTLIYWLVRRRPSSEAIQRSHQFALAW
jgi:hypothetical protein